MPDSIPGRLSEDIDEAAANEYSRDEQSQKIIRFLDKLKAEEIFKDGGSKRQFIECLDFETFKNLLFAVNAVTRNISTTQRAADGDAVYLKGFIESDYPPKQNDKEELLARVFNDTKDMNAKGRDLKDIALLMGASINALHLFNDSNGRTSRLTYSLLAHEFGDHEEKVDYLKNILGEHGREVVDINPDILFINEIDPIIEDDTRESVNPKPIWLRTWKQNSEIRQSLREKGVTEEDIEFMIEHCQHDRQGFLALEKYLFTKGELENYVESFDQDKPNRSDINFDKVINELTLEDVAGIKEQYWNLKKRRVEILIDMILNPENYPSREIPNKTAKEFFEEKILERSNIDIEVGEQEI